MSARPVAGKETIAFPRKAEKFFHKRRRLILEKAERERASQSLCMEQTASLSKQREAGGGESTSKMESDLEDVSTFLRIYWPKGED